MKTLTNSGDFTGSRIRISNSGGTEVETSIQQKANSQSSARGFEKKYLKTLQNFFLMFHYHLRLTEQFTESQVAS
jgi:hypothetical protein